MDGLWVAEFAWGVTLADEAFAGALVWDGVGHAVDGGAGWAVEFVAVVVEDEAGGDWGGWAGGAAGGDLHVAGGVVPVDVGAEGFGKDADWQQGAAVFDHWGDVALFGDAVVEVGGVTDDEIGGGAAFFHADAAAGVVPDDAGAHGFGGGAHWQKDAAVFDDRRHVALDEGAVDVHRDGTAGLALRRVRPICLRRRRQHSNKRRHQHSGQDGESLFHDDVPPFFEYDDAFMVSCGGDDVKGFGQGL